MLIEFCLPVYNEEKILEKNVRGLLAYCLEADFSFDWNIKILDNGSTDQTPEICRKLEGGKIGIETTSLPGKGRAIMSYLEKSRSDILVYMDIDLAVDLKHIPELLALLLDEGCDLAFGSRLLPESETRRPILREWSSRCYNVLSRIILDQEFSDLQCGFKAIKTDAFRQISGNIKDQKWFFDTELVAFSQNAGFKIGELPVCWEENRWDERKSKINIASDSLTFIKNLLALRARLHKLKNTPELQNKNYIIDAEGFLDD